MTHDKTVYLDGRAIGTARTWPEVALLLKRTGYAALAQSVVTGRGMSEGRDAFYVETPERC